MHPPGSGQAGGVATAGARLYVVSRDQKGRCYALDSQLLTIGRGINNDIVTSDPHASRVHAEIRQVGQKNRYILTDPGSTNGTVVNGQRISEVELHDGDLIEIGDFSLIVDLSAHGPAYQATAAASASGATRPSTLPDTFDLRQQPTLTIGRDPANDLTLDHPQISRHHARLQLQPDGALAVTDLNSTNGTYIDGQHLRGAATAPSGAVLTFGPFRLLYQDGQLIKGTEDGTVRIDCLHLGKQVQGGKVLLHDLTFSILPREFVCIVGGSGTGKSTLLDAISGVRPANAGEVRYNGVNFYAQIDSYRAAIGYVPQDDIVPAELPVQHALYYAAKLRLPPDTSEAEVRARVEEVMDDLGLTARRDVPIKNLSGGQRKRVSIGAELLSQPTLFFLDEPTSGLDPGLEGRMMALLRKLADQGRTVVLITHATQNVDLCDNIAFLASGGHLAYYGPPNEALSYFGVEKFADIYTHIEQEPDQAVWSERFQRSPAFTKYVAARLATAGIGVNGAGAAADGSHTIALARIQARPPAAKKVSGLRQFKILTQRYLETVVRDRNNLLVMLALQAPLIAILVALAFHGDILSRVVGTGNNGAARKLTFLLAMVVVWFGTSNSAREIVKEAGMYARERRINLKIGPYIGSKFCVQLGLSLLQTLVLLLPFLIVGAGLGRLPMLYLSLVAGSVAGIGLGLVISSLAPNPDRASILVPLALIPQIIFSGGLIDLNSNAFVNAVSQLMVTKWTWRALGATVGIDSIPMPLVEISGFDKSQAPQIAAQLTAMNTHMSYDTARQTFYYLPTWGQDFVYYPFVYLVILALFIAVSLVLIAYFQRRKDIVR
jgi:ABC transport system ATP-binding/permease protein